MKKQVLLIVISCFSILTLWSQDLYDRQVPLIGDKAVSFKAESTKGKIVFPDDFGSKWKILFSHPKAFTPVCSSELLELANISSDFEELNAEIIIVSTDKLSQHESWIESMETLDYNNMGKQKINFSLISDESRDISLKYGMIHPESSTTMSVRGVFIISPDNIIEYVSYYPMEVGRNINEIKRTLIALQTAKNNISTPANWEPGNDVMLSYLYDGQKDEMKKPGSKIYQVAWYMTFMKP